MGFQLFSSLNSLSNKPISCIMSNDTSWSFWDKAHRSFHSLCVTWIMAPPGHYVLGKESISQLTPLTHRTSAAKDIIKAGYLCQQRRNGGINLSSGKNLYRERASHEIDVNAESAKWMVTPFLGTDFWMWSLQQESGNMTIGMENLHWNFWTSNRLCRFLVFDGFFPSFPAYFKVSGVNFSVPPYSFLFF